MKSNKETQRRTSRKGLVLAGLCVVAVAAAIYMLTEQSPDATSAESDFVEAVLERLFRGHPRIYDASQGLLLGIGVRHWAHVVEFGVLGLFVAMTSVFALRPTGADESGEDGFKKGSTAPMPRIADPDDTAPLPFVGDPASTAPIAHVSCESDAERARAAVSDSSAFQLPDRQGSHDAQTGQAKSSMRIVPAGLVALVVCGAYSLFDQCHKLFVPGRHFDYVDLVMDAAGYGCAIVLVLLVTAIVRRSRLVSRWH